MFKSKRILFFVMVAILLLALPTGVLAGSKKIFKAKLVPIVEGASSTGGLVLQPSPEGYLFSGAIKNNVSPVNGIYILKKDDGGGELFRLSLCDMPDAICEVQDDGSLVYEGLIKLTPESGVTGKQLKEAVEAEQIEGLVTTEENPDGEAGGLVKRIR